MFGVLYCVNPFEMHKATLFRGIGCAIDEPCGTHFCSMKHGVVAGITTAPSKESQGGQKRLPTAEKQGL